MKPYVFVGPSISVEEASQILDAHYLPPAAMADLYRLLYLPEPPATVVLIDGLFEQQPAVWHKEILALLDRGTRVIGASSMGALRAAELHALGMIGVGAIFESFRDGDLDDDDEVTISHAAAEHGYRALSDAMVNLRHGLAIALSREIIAPPVHDRLIERSKARFYADRSWASVLDDARELGIDAAGVAALRDIARSPEADLKRRDARAALERAKEHVGEASPKGERQETIETATYILIDEAMSTTAAPPVRHRMSASGVARFARATHADPAALWDGALQLFANATFAVQRGRFANLPEAVAWLAHPAIAEAPVEAVQSRINELEAMAMAASPVMELLVLVELARRGELSGVKATAERSWLALNKTEREFPSGALADGEVAELLARLRSEIDPATAGGLADECARRRLDPSTLLDCLVALLGSR